MVFAPSRPPDEATRRAAAESIRRTYAKVDLHRTVHRISDSEVDAAIDEAMNHIRPRPG